MRGLTVVLYVAVLLSLLIGAFAACGANGDAHGSICVCKSGFSGAACDAQAASCDALEAVKYPAADVADNFPQLNGTDGATVFKGNNLYATIYGDHVANRTYLELNFTNSGSNAKCSFGTAQSYWTMDFGCKDRFNLKLPWVEHTSCGFVNDTTKTNSKDLVITNTLHLTYEDWVYIDMGADEETGEHESYMLQRRVNIPYRISVKFQKWIDVQLLALIITSDVQFGAALTGDEFDPTNGVLNLTLTTLINYPNSFRGDKEYIHFYTPETVLAIDNLGPVNPISGVAPNYGPVQFYNIETIQRDCPWQSQVPCRQEWRIRAKLSDAEVCTFNGNYSLQLTLFTCRSPNSYLDQSCTFTVAYVNFTITTNDVCGKIDIEPAVSGELVPYKHGIDISRDVEAGPPMASRKKTFKLGEFGDFWADIKSAGNDIKINFTQIRFQDKEHNSTWTNLMENSVIDLTNNKNLAKLNVFHAEKRFSVYFHSSVFFVPPNGRVTYTFSATVDILFSGNEGEQKKRSVEYTFEADSLSAETNVFLSAAKPAVTPVSDKSVVEADNGVNQTTFIGAVVGAIAGTMIIVFVVVGVALRSRNQSAQRDVAASAAVVAANAAAQSIEVVSRV